MVRRRLLPLTALLAFAALAGACGDDDGVAVTTTTAGSAAEVEVTAERGCGPADGPYIYVTVTGADAGDAATAELVVADSVILSGVVEAAGNAGLDVSTLPSNAWLDEAGAVKGAVQVVDADGNLLATADEIGEAAGLCG